jgi:hypothetical protein
MTKPFKILGIQQIAIGGENKDRLRKLWVDTRALLYPSVKMWMRTFVRLVRAHMKLR